MADITPPVPEGRQIIQGYGDGRFRIAGAVHTGSVIVLPGKTLPWGIESLGAATVESLAPVLDARDDTDLLLIGCGRAIAALEPALERALRGAGIAVERMDTGAACRTFNVLLGEERRVAAALIAVA